jgi:hypothetical protein
LLGHALPSKPKVSYASNVISLFSLGDLFLGFLRQDIFLPEFNDLAVIAAEIKSYVYKL